MVRLLTDENFHGNIIKGLLMRRPGLDLVRVQDVGLEGADDPAVLEWAATENRIVLTHDRATMPDFACCRLNAGQEMPGIFVINQQGPVRQTIDEILVIDACSDQSEWAGLVVYLPL